MNALFPPCIKNENNKNVNVAALSKHKITTRSLTYNVKVMCHFRGQEKRYDLIIHSHSAFAKIYYLF